MRIVAIEIQVDGRHEDLVPPTSLVVADGQIAYVASDQDRSTALALALSGRLDLSSGHIDLRGAGGRGLAEVSAIVDAPEVSAPLDELNVRDAVAESLAISGHASSRAAARDWLNRHGLGDLCDRPMSTLDGPQRLAVLSALAITAPHVRLVVLDTPDRHRGDLDAWNRIAMQLAHNGYAVIVICDPRSAQLLDVPAFEIGTCPPLALEDEQPDSPLPDAPQLNAPNSDAHPDTPHPDASHPGAHS